MERELIEALNRIAEAIQANADATVLLARATAGEFDEQEPEGLGVRSLSDRA